VRGPLKMAQADSSRMAKASAARWGKSRRMGIDRQ
jgi:hypothetical protein